MNRAINHLSSFFFFLLACLVAAGLPQQTAVVHAATLHVGGTDPSAYSTIQVALDDAVAGDTVLVHAGTYYENVILKSGVSLSGEGADVTKIIGQEVIGALSAVISAQNVTSASIRNLCVAMRDASRDSIGLYITNSSIQIIRNVVDNTAKGADVSGSDVNILNNVFYSVSGDRGITILDSSALVKNNIIMNYNTGISVSGRSDARLSHNDLFRCTDCYSGTAPGTGAISADPLFVAPGSGDFHLREMSPCIDSGDPSDAVPPLGGSRIDIGAFEFQYPPPAPVIVEGPQASIISETEVRIVWQTSTPCYSTVMYGMTAGSFDLEQHETPLIAIHSITLTGLSPSTTYEYFVRCEDATGNMVESEPTFFTTPAAPDSEPPSLDVNIPDRITGPVAVHAQAADNNSIEALEFYVDDQRRYTVFGHTADWIFDPSGLSNGSHTLKVVTRDKAGGYTIQEADVEVALPPPDASPPYGGIISPEPDTTVSGSSVTIEAWGLDPESGINTILFYVNDELLHVADINGAPGADEHTSFQWNSFGAAYVQDNEIRVEIVNNAGLSETAVENVGVFNAGSIFDETPGPFFNFKLIKLTRGQVKRDGIYYEAKLYVQNISPVILQDVTVYDTHAGFQAIQSDYGYRPRVRFDPAARSSQVMFALGDLMPGEVKECTVNMSTVLVSPDPQNFNYGIGRETEVNYTWLSGDEYVFSSLIYHLPAAKAIEGWWGTDEIPLTTSTILGPVSQRDYLVVTHPRKLYAIYDVLEVNELLSELARFVRRKNAVLAYLDSPAARSELLNLAGHKNAIPLGGAAAAGGWSRLLHPDWSQNGYMLLTGETEIIPSFTIILTIPEGQYTLPLCDQPYADLDDDGYPDLTLGRIIGDFANILMMPIVTSRLVQSNFPGYDFDASDVLLMSGKGSHETSFVNNINDISYVMNTEYAPPLSNDKYHRTDFLSAQDAWDNLDPLVSGKDIIYYNGHGGPGGWGHVLDEMSVQYLNFNGVRPCIFSFACSTGYYEPAEGETGAMADFSLGEAFFIHDAGLFIGATHMSNTGFNSVNGLSFFRNFWRPEKEIGATYRDFERYLWSQYHQNHYHWRFVLGYNIYGDPRFGYNIPENQPLSVSEAPRAGDTPPEGTVLEIPDYTVTSIDGLDYVEIPGGDLLVDPGQYRVPFWVEQIEIPTGYVVQDVSMRDRSGMKTDRGLHLPVIPDDFLENDTGEPFVPEEYLWYPDGPFRWEVMPGDDNSRTLVLMVYPFIYNTQTTEIQFYTHYEFDFSITKSSVEITEMSAEREAVLPGQPVQILVAFYNQEEQDHTVRLRGVIEPYAGELHIDGLPLHTLELPPGSSALMESWDTGETPDGHYRVTVVLEDLDGNVLDTAGAHFTIGADPADICTGDSQADGDVDGHDLVFYINNGEFSNIAEFAAAYGNLCP